jgi:fibronectin-binding autotransporter adhesin
MNSTTTRRTHLATMVALLGTSFLLSQQSTAQTTLTWSGGTGGSGTAWATNTNWATSIVPGSNSVTTNNDIAAFGATGTGTQMQMNFGTLGTPFYLGTINILSGNTVAKTMGANTATAGIVQLNGTGTNNLILSNASTSLFTLAPLAGGSGTGMSLRLNATNSEITGTGGITISAPITETSGGAKGFTKTGTGTLTLSGANTFTGAVRVFEGGLSLTTVSGGSSLGTSAATLQLGNVGTSSNATLTLTGGTTSYAQAITVTGTGGTKLLTKNNSSGYTFTGGLTLNDNLTILRQGSGTVNTTFSTGGISIDTGKTLTLTTNNSSGILLSSAISGGGGVAVNSSAAGATTLSGTNTFTGGINVIDVGTGTNTGSLRITTGSNLGTGALTAGLNANYGTAYASGGNAFLFVNNTAAVSLSNNIAISAGDATTRYYTLMKDAASSSTGTNLTLSGIISGGGANTILQLDSDTGGDSTTNFTLSGNNTITGQVRLNRGYLNLANVNALGTASLFLQTNANATAGNVNFSGFTTLTNNLIIGTTTNQWINTGSSDITLSGVVSSGTSGSGGFSKMGTGTLTLTGANTYNGSTTTVADGTLAITGSGRINSTAYTGSLVLSAASSILDYSSSTDQTLSGVVSGSGGIVKSGISQLTLSATNTYTGITTVSAGTLVVTGSLASNLASSNFIAAPDDSLVGNPLLTRRIVEGGSYSNFGSTSTGGLNSTAELLAGVVVGAVTPGDNADVSMAWRTRTSAESTGAGTPILMSNVLDLEGVAVVSGLERDLFVLQMSYDASAAIAAPTEIYLATLNAGAWVNATATNTGNNATVAQMGYIGSFSQFQLDNPGALNSYIGAYGVDPVSNKAWAVLNHNSEFAVIPEPATLVTGGLAVLGLGYTGLRRRRTQS